jgi:hypothetical protein
MKRPIPSLLLQLAGSDASIGEIRALAEWIRSEGPNALTSAVSRLRNTAQSLAQERNGESSDDAFVGARIDKRNVMLADLANISAPARQVVELLMETGLPMGKAASLLLSALLKHAGEQELRITEQQAKSLPNPTRDFGAWLTALGNIVPFSMILHHATRIRNEYVHKQEPIWPLRERE